MAKLIRDDAQVKACEEINSMLEEVEQINKKLLSKDPISIEVNKKQSIQIDDTYTDKIRTILKQQRQKRIKDIQNKADKFRISLDDSEQYLISDAAINEKPINGKEKSKEPVKPVEVKETDHEEADRPEQMEFPFTDIAD